MGLFWKKKKDTSDIFIWGIDQFADYMDDNVKLGGNSRKFEDIHKGIQAFQEARREPEEGIRAMAMAAANDRLLLACEVYMEKRDGATTSLGKERLDVARLLYKRQKEMNLESHTLSINQYDAFLESSKRMGDSELYKDVRAKVKDIKKLFDSPVTEQTRKQMQEARQALEEACKTYISERKGAKSKKGRERLYAVNALLARQERELGGHLTNQELPGGMDEYKGMTWGQVDNRKAADMSHSIAAKQCEPVIEEQKKIIDAIGSESVTMESAMRITKADQAYLKACETWLKNVPEPSNDEEREKYARISQEYERQRDRNLGQLRDVNILQEYAGRNWASIDHVRISTARLEGKRITVGEAASERIMVEVNGKKGFFTQSKAFLRPEEEFDSYVKELDDPYMRDLLGKYRNVLRVKAADDKELEKEPWLIVSASMVKDKKEAAETVRNHLLANGIKDREILDNDAAINHCVTMMDHAQKNWIAHNAANFGSRTERGRKAGKAVGTIDYGDDFAKRNVASTRVADYLGMGRFLARSEFMVLDDNGRSVMGTFMEFAKGTDVQSDNPEDKEKLASVKSLYNADFVRSACDMAVFDHICGQIDRHGGNMFYELSDPDAEGHREIIGLQGIDNDMSFLEHTDEFIHGGQHQLKGMVLISKSLKAMVLSMNRDSLDYLLGDVLKKEEIDAAEKRLTDTQAHIRKNMLALDDNDWDFKKYDINDPNLDAEGKFYTEKVNLYIQQSEKKLYAWDAEFDIVESVKEKFKSMGYTGATKIRPKENKTEEVKMEGNKAENKKAASVQKLDRNELEREERGPVKRSSFSQNSQALKAPEKTIEEPKKVAASRR